MQVRPADERELDQLARVWFDAWNDAHARIVPPELKRRRTLHNFRDRLRAALSQTRVFGPPGAPVGFYVLKHAELYQLFVSAEARGSGVAAALLADAEASRGERRADGVARVRDWQRPRGEVLREVRMAAGRHHGQRGRDVGRDLPARRVALRKGVAP